MKKLLGTGLLVAMMTVVVTGCKSNPYEDKPKVEPVKKVVPTPVPTPTPEPTPTPTPTPTPAPTPTPTPTPVYSLEAPGVMRFKEGVRTSYIVRGSVPPPGTPQITFTGLQTGMTYNAAEQKLYWTAPSGDAGRTFVVEVRLKSSADPVTALVKESVGVVESALAPAIALAKADGDSREVQLQYTAVGADAPNWMIHGAKPGEVQFVTVKFPASPVDGLLGNLLSMNWKIDPVAWGASSSRDIKIVACNADGTACNAQEVKLKFDPFKGVQLVHPETATPVELGR